MTLSDQTQAIVRKFITQQEAADYSGVTARTIRNWISEGKIKAYKLPGGNLVRIDLNELNAAIEGGAIPAVQR